MKIKSLHSLVALAGLLLAGPALANTVTVTKLADDGSPGTLRWAVGAASPGGVITFAGALPQVQFLGIVVPPEIVLTNGPLNIGRDLTIIGPPIRIPGPLGHNLVVNGNNASRVLVIGGGNVTIFNLDIENGSNQTIENPNDYTRSYDSGDGQYDIINVGPDDAVEGGGIYVGPGASLNLLNCSISYNVNVNAGANGPPSQFYDMDGGGIFNGGTLNLNNCTLAGNQLLGWAWGGGQGGVIAGSAIYNRGACAMVNCTVCGNSMSGTDPYDASTNYIYWGGTIFNTSAGFLTLSSCTISGNKADQLIGGVGNSGQITLVNTIIASNSAPFAPDTAGSFTSQGFNLIGSASESTGWIASDQTGSDLDPLNPLLGPLQYNGGTETTPTMAPQTGSAAIDQGYSAGLTDDQRGLPRPKRFNLPLPPGGDGSDIGAVELQQPSLQATVLSGRVTLAFSSDAVTADGGPGYAVQSSPGGLMSGSTGWSDRTNTVRMIGGSFVARDELVSASAANFFRLAGPRTNLSFVPSPTTLPASVFTPTSAALNGRDVPVGNGTAWWFVYYAANTNYGLSTKTNGLATSTNPTNVSLKVTGLTPQTLYHCQLVVTDDWGTQSGGDVTFFTPGPPIVVTEPALSLTSSGATLYGTVNPNGAVTTCYFRYGLDTNYGLTTPTQVVTNGSGTLNVTAPISGLAASTPYHFQLVASNFVGMATGIDLTFTTTTNSGPGLPVVTTLPAYNVGAYGAFLDGTVAPNGADATYFYQYGTDTNYGQTVPATPGVVPAGSGAQDVATSVGPLAPATTYHFQLVASNSVGVSTGVDLTFTTSNQPPPSVVTGPATAITLTTALLNGTINPNGNSIGYYFEYGTSTNYGLTTPLVDDFTGVTVNPSATISNLAQTTTYHYRLDAFNTANPSQFTYGADSNFTTVAIQPPPAVVTGTASGVTTSTAQMNGTVNPNADNTTAWYEYGTTTGYGNTTTPVSVGNGATPQSFPASLSGLASSTTYHYRLDANNSGGTSYGTDTNFTTVWAALPPTPISPGTATDTGYTVASLAPTLLWSGFSQAAFYNLAISQYPSGPVVYSYPFNVTNVTIPGNVLMGGTKYSWNVSSVNGLGDTSANSMSLIFQTPPLPTVQTLPATNILGTQSVRLSGSVNPNGYGTAVYFEYGPTTNYVSSTTQTNIGTTAGIYSAVVGGLFMTNTYHYRVDAVSANGTSRGQDVIFLAP